MFISQEVQDERHDNLVGKVPVIIGGGERLHVRKCSLPIWQTPLIGSAARGKALTANAF
jgi:hypothetical protein